MPHKDQQRRNEYARELRKKRPDKKRGRKELECENEKQKIKRRKGTERVQKHREKNKANVLKVKIGSHQATIKQEPCDDAISGQPNSNTGDDNRDGHAPDKDDVCIRPSVLHPLPTVRLQSPTRPSQYHTPGFPTPQLTSLLLSFADPTPGPSNASTPTSPFPRSCSCPCTCSSKVNHKHTVIPLIVEKDCPLWRPPPPTA
jgi:hypothetical protein